MLLNLSCLLCRKSGQGRNSGAVGWAGGAGIDEVVLVVSGLRGLSWWSSRGTGCTDWGLELRGTERTESGLDLRGIPNSRSLCREGWIRLRKIESEMSIWRRVHKPVAHTSG